MKINPKLLEGTTLWENSNPSGGISSLINLNDSLENYKAIKIFFRQWVQTATNDMLEYDAANNNFSLNYIEAGDGYWVMRSRNLVKSSNTQLSVANGYQAVTGSLSQSNNVCVPVKIIGYK